MTSNDILKADMLDILFENRNKQYGAYVLRKNYSKRLTLSVTVTLVFIFVALYFLQPGMNEKIMLPNVPPVVITQVDMPKITLVEPVKPAGSAPVRRQAQTAFTSKIEIRRDAETEVPELRRVGDLQIGNDNLEGELSNLIPKQRSWVVGTGDPTKKEHPVSAPLLQRDPEFPGGIAAWLEFLRKNLVSPSELDAGEQRSVIVKFDVAADGTVTGFDVVQSAGKLFDNEVIRVLKKMPKWKPAIQDGVAVAKTYTQPVTFVGVE